MDGHLRICYDMRILSEYTGVLERPKFRISPVLSAKLLEQVRAAGELICAAPLPLRLSDPSDVAFLEVALAAHAECLITGNIRHFPSSCRQGMRVFSPAEFLEFYRDATDHAGGMVKSPDDEYRVSKRAGNRKGEAPSSRNARPMLFSEFTRRIDATREPGNVNWTPAEVEKVIQSIRRERGSLKPTKGCRKTARGSDIPFRTTRSKAILRHLDHLIKNKL